MGIWVVVLEAVAGDDPNTIEPDDLDALAEELADNYPQVSGGPAFYQAEFWVEEANAGGAVMNALMVWQTAVRELGMPTWDVVRAEARDAHAIDAGLIDWAPASDDEPDDEFVEVDEVDEVELDAELDADVDDGLVDTQVFDDDEVDDNMLDDDVADDDLADDDMLDDEPAEEPEEEPPPPPPPPKPARARSRGGRLRPLTEVISERTSEPAPVKTAVKKVTVRKATLKKTAAAKAPVTKAAVKKAPVKKPAVKRAAVRKASAPKAVVKRTGGRARKGR